MSTQGIPIMLQIIFHSSMIFIVCTAAIILHSVRASADTDNLCFMKSSDYLLKKPEFDEGVTIWVDLEQKKNSIVKSFSE